MVSNPSTPPPTPDPQCPTPSPRNHLLFLSGAAPAVLAALRRLAAPLWARSSEIFPILHILEPDPARSTPPCPCPWCPETACSSSATPSPADFPAPPLAPFHANRSSATPSLSQWRTAAPPSLCATAPGVLEHRASPPPTGSVSPMAGTAATGSRAVGSLPPASTAPDSTPASSLPPHLAPYRCPCSLSPTCGPHIERARGFRPLPAAHLVLVCACWPWMCSSPARTVQLAGSTTSANPARNTGCALLQFGWDSSVVQCLFAFKICSAVRWPVMCGAAPAYRREGRWCVPCGSPARRLQLTFEGTHFHLSVVRFFGVRGSLLFRKTKR